MISKASENIIDTIVEIENKTVVLQGEITSISGDEIVLENGLYIKINDNMETFIGLETGDIIKVECKYYTEFYNYLYFNKAKCIENKLLIRRNRNGISKYSDK